MRTHTIEPKDLNQFMRAGRAVFTVENKVTGGRFTFKVSQCVEEDGTRKELWFVKVLTGPDNTNDYLFTGTIRPDGTYHHSKKSRISEAAPSVLAFKWVLKAAAHPDKWPHHVAVHHEGQCGRCGRTLTVPESIESGYGPECITKIGGHAA